eukprot:scaffold5876_cov363-Chaetoceros_neogracile.AAC.1
MVSAMQTMSIAVTSGHAHLKIDESEGLERTSKILLRNSFPDHLTTVLGHEISDNGSDLIHEMLNNRLVLYGAKGDLVEYRKALEIRLKVLGPNHPNTAESYNIIGSVYHGKGDYENSLFECCEALEIHLKVLEPDHSEIAISYNDIGAV